MTYYSITLGLDIDDGVITDYNDGRSTPIGPDPLTWDAHDLSNFIDADWNDRVEVVEVAVTP